MVTVRILGSDILIFCSVASLDKMLSTQANKIYHRSIELNTSMSPEPSPSANCSYDETYVDQNGVNNNN